MDVLLTQNFDELNKKGLDVFIGWRKNIYGFFEVAEVERGRYFQAREVWTDREYKVLEYMGTLQMEEGDILLGRLFPYQRNYILSGVATRWKKELNYSIKREVARIKEKEGKIDLTPKEVEKYLFQKGKERVAGKEREMIEKRLRRKLHHYLGKRFKLKDLQRLEADEFIHLIIDY